MRAQRREHRLIAYSSIGRSKRLITVTERSNFLPERI